MSFKSEKLKLNPTKRLKKMLKKRILGSKSLNSVSQVPAQVPTPTAIFLHYVLPITKISLKKRILRRKIRLKKQTRQKKILIILPQAMKTSPDLVLAHLPQIVKLSANRSLQFCRN